MRGGWGGETGSGEERHMRGCGGESTMWSGRLPFMCTSFEKCAGSDKCTGQQVGGPIIKV